MTNISKHIQGYSKRTLVSPKALKESWWLQHSNHAGCMLRNETERDGATDKYWYFITNLNSLVEKVRTQFWEPTCRTHVRRSPLNTRNNIHLSECESKLWAWKYARSSKTAKWHPTYQAMLKSSSGMCVRVCGIYVTAISCSLVCAISGWLAVRICPVTRCWTALKFGGKITYKQPNN